MRKWTKILFAELLLLVIICTYNNIVFIAFLWVILHEITHILFARYYDCKFNNIEIHVFGTKADIVNFDELQDYKKIIIYLSGPLFNLLMAIILISLNSTQYLVEQSISINLGLAIFNLLPAYPLDGSRIYEILLSKNLLYKKAQRILSFISYGVAIIFILLCVYSYFFLHTMNLSMVLAALIIALMTYNESKSAMYILMGNVIKKRNIFNKNKYIENKSISLHYRLGLVNALSIIDKNKFNMFYVLNDDMKLLYILYEDELVEALKKYGNITLEEYYVERNAGG